MKVPVSLILIAGFAATALGQSGLFMDYVTRIKSHIREIDVATMEKLRAENPDLIVIDVRERDEWQAGRLQGAVHLSKGVLEWKIQRLAPKLETPVILYCGGGNRSAISARNLQEMGYSRVYSLAGGYGAIMDAGLAVEAGEDE